MTSLSAAEKNEVVVVQCNKSYSKSTTGTLGVSTAIPSLQSLNLDLDLSCENTDDIIYNAG